MGRTESVGYPLVHVTARRWEAGWGVEMRRQGGKDREAKVLPLEERAMRRANALVCTSTEPAWDCAHMTQ